MEMKEANETNQLESRLEKKKIYRQLFQIGIPVAFQSLLVFFVNLLDTIMLGQLGEVEISAAALSNQIFFILSLLIYGIVGGSNVLVSQFWGKKDKSSITRVLSYTYQIGLGITLLVSLLGILFPLQILSVFSSDIRVIEAGQDYMRIVSCSYLFYAFTTLTTGTLRAVRSVAVSVTLSAVALVVNGSLNYILIFGKLGFPAMGVAGAAVATLIARAAETLLLIWYLKFREKDLRLDFRKLLRLDKTIAKGYFHNTLPVMLNELFWSVGSSVLAIIVGRMSTEFVAANNIFGTTGQIASVLAQGLNAAGAVMIGNTIGTGNKQRVLLLKKQLQIVGLVSGVFSALLILALRPLMLMFYNVSETTLQYTNQIMYVGALIQVFKTAQGMNMMGILRGGGDARFVMVNDIVFLWTLAVPLGFITGLVLHWPVPIVYCILNIEQFIKLFTSTARLRNDKWIKNVTSVGKKEVPDVPVTEAES